MSYFCPVIRICRPHYVLLFADIRETILLKSHAETIHPLLGRKSYMQFSHTTRILFRSPLQKSPFPIKYKCQLCEHSSFTVAVMRNTSKDTAQHFRSHTYTGPSFFRQHYLHVYIHQYFQPSSFKIHCQCLTFL